MGLVQYLYLVFRAITVHKFEAQQKQYKAWFLEFPAGTSGDHPGIYSQTQTAGCGEAGTFGAGKFSSSMGGEPESGQTWIYAGHPQLNGLKRTFLAGAMRCVHDSHGGKPSQVGKLFRWTLGRWSHGFRSLGLFNKDPTMAVGQNHGSPQLWLFTNHKWR